VNIYVFDQQHHLEIVKQQVVELTREVLQQESIRCNEVSIYFVTPEVISDLHSQYFGDESPTDCISFPMDESDTIGYRILGEVFVCPQTAIDYASSEPLAEPYHETTLYIVHGLLHLIGYEDKGKKEEKMRQAERTHMRNLEKQQRVLHRPRF